MRLAGSTPPFLQVEELSEQLTFQLRGVKYFRDIGPCDRAIYPTISEPVNVPLLYASNAIEEAV